MAAFYIYRGKGTKTSTPADAILAFENPAGVTDGINILFGDGSVQFVEMCWATELIARG